MLRSAATVMTILAAAIVAANWNARLTVSGFALFILASTAWMLDGWFEEKSSLVIQNAVLLVINIFGVYRWLPRRGRNAVTWLLPATADRGGELPL
jgi:hypothetical protein